MELEDITVTTEWVENVVKRLGVDSVAQLSPYVCSKPKKESIGEWLCDSLCYLKRACDALEKLKAFAEPLQSELIKSQQQVISLQDELLRCKNDEIQALQSSVQKSVTESVKTEFATYSSKLQSSAPVTAANTAKLKEVVKSAVVEDTKSKNVMIFGKSEAENEDLTATVDNIMEDINEKPRILECIRVGVRQNGKQRPIKVRLGSAEAVASILRNAKHLKNSTTNKNTFIGPDRTIEERDIHKKLVAKMKVMIGENADKYHYIRGGVIISVDKKTDKN